MGGESKMKGSESCKLAALLFYSTSTYVSTFCGITGAVCRLCIKQDVARLTSLFFFLNQGLKIQDIYVQQFICHWPDRIMKAIKAPNSTFKEITDK